MFIVENYSTAVVLCFITMLCWGSWANTQKLASKSWRFELFYWDYVLGILLCSIISAFSLGSIGSEGRSFMTDIGQVDPINIASALTGGVIFNLANILLSAAIAIAGLSVAFPIGIGIALVLGVFINYISSEKGDPVLLAVGVLLITVAIILNAIAYNKSSSSRSNGSARGILISIIAGVLMAFFYRFVASSMDLENFANPRQGMMTPYTAFFVFSIGIFSSNFIFNTILMRYPIEGPPITISQYFKGKISTHSVGILGGIIWGIGNLLNLIAAEKAGPAISYGLGQGATLIAAFWGVFIWKEFQNAPKTVSKFVAAMFFFFIIGIVMLIYAGV
jgi:glucose uptake protein